MKIVTIYHSFLRKTVEPVKVFNQELATEAQEMLELMHQGNGIGLAANQVGLNKRLIVMEHKSVDKKTESVPLLILANPQIVRISRQTDEMVEGCLSLPSIELPVVRPSAVVVKAQDLKGKPITVKAKGLTARVIQHEVDHLNGVLFTDHVNLRIINDYRWYASLKIVFAGSDEFSLPTAQALYQFFPNFVVITESAKPSGRGQRVLDNPVAKWAKLQGINTVEIEKSADIAEFICQYRPHLAVLASFGRIIDSETLNMPTYGWLNLHPSLLPKYRGSTPIQRAILEGTQRTGVSLIKMTEKIDQGEIIGQTAYCIKNNQGFINLREKLAEKAAQLLITSLPIYLTGQAELKAQDHKKASYARKISKDDGLIDWSKTDQEIARQINAFEYWPLSYTFVDGKRLIIRQAHLEDNHLVIDKVQLEGKKPVWWEDFVRGYHRKLIKEEWFDRIKRC